MVGYKEKKEPWNYYELEDGSKIKIKTILISLFDEKTSSSEDFEYSLQTNFLAGVEPDKSLVGNKSLTRIDDIPYKILSEDWSEYLVNDGPTIIVKSIITQINRTGELDEKSLPVYAIEVSPVIKMKC